MNERPLVTIITPVYNEEEGLLDYAESVKQVLFSRDDIDFEVILIDDGSRDTSWAKIEEICRSDERYRAIKFSRNFGSHRALSAGFKDAKGDAAAFLPCDLQDPPEMILAFIDKWKNGAEIIFGHRSERNDPLFKKITSCVFNYLFKNYAMPQGSQFSSGSFLLADRKVIDCFNEFPEYNRITFAMFAWSGFRQEKVDYVRKKRMSGSSKWNYARLMSAFYDAIIGYSHLPIRMITLIGLFTFILSSGLICYAIVISIAGNTFPGWASLILVISFFSSMQFIILSLIGEYLYRLYLEIVRRPLYLISERI